MDTWRGTRPRRSDASGNGIEQWPRQEQPQGREPEQGPERQEEAKPPRFMPAWSTPPASGPGIFCPLISRGGGIKRAERLSPQEKPQSTVRGEPADSRLIEVSLPGAARATMLGTTHHLDHLAAGLGTLAERRDDLFHLGVVELLALRD